MVFQGPFQLRTLSICLVPVLFGVACSVGSAGEAVLVSTVVDQATAAVDDLVAEGFDRLEASVSLAGSQARASVDHAASETGCCHVQYCGRARWPAEACRL